MLRFSLCKAWRQRASTHRPQKPTVGAETAAFTAGGRVIELRRAPREAGDLTRGVAEPATRGPAPREIGGFWQEEAHGRSHEGRGKRRCWQRSSEWCRTRG
eukprot:3405192-Rhodomonas_salina.2